jgi:hypothetical protein
MRISPVLRFAPLLLVVFLSGCARTGGEGTQGILRQDHEPLGNTRVTVNRVVKNSIESIGFGVTDADGTFQLVTGTDGRGLCLPAGDYRFTLKSVGAQVRIPNEYAQVNLTPLRLSWSGGDQPLKLEMRVKSGQSPTAQIAR